ncbi:MAG: acireductone synthase [Thioalkalispiraceae bacterium]
MIRAIVTDIEGTTSSISFVHDVLFPYAKEHIADFVRDNAQEPAVAAHIDNVRSEVGEQLDTEAVIVQLEKWIEQDKKVTPLKALQGLIWEKGYQRGDFQGHVYPDAVEKLKKWHEQGIKLYVYSSGSVYAQKLLFSHTEFGNLTYLFDGYFDTRVGAKIDSDSYQNILEQIKLSGSEVLFLSDLEKELDAASAAGLHTICLARENENQISQHHMVTGFDQIKM